MLVTTAGTPAGSSTPSAAAQNLALGAALHVTGDNSLSAFVTVESVKYETAGIGAAAQAPQNGLYAVVDVAFPR